MAKKRVLIVYAKAGDGHRKAAEAVLEGFKAINRHDLEIRLIDALDYTTKSFKFFYPRIYILLINRLKFLWGFSYYILENRLVWSFASKIRHLANSLNTKKLRNLIFDFKPDMIVCAHFLAVEVASRLKKNKLITSKLVCVLTDYLPHSVWLSDEVDFYLVGSGDSFSELVKRGIPSLKIKITGIPVSLNFSKNFDRKNLIERFGLKTDCFTILITSGGYGVGPVKRLITNLAGADFVFQVILICGRNKRLKAYYEAKKNNFKFFLRIFGFVDNMNELMAVSDVVITKAGGITSTEALEMRLPMLIVFPVPGQEKRNAFVLEKHKIAIVIKKIEDISKAVSALNKNPGELLQMKENIKSFAAVSPALKAAEFINKLL